MFQILDSELNDAFIALREAEKLIYRNQDLRNADCSAAIKSALVCIAEARAAIVEGVEADKRVQWNDEAEFLNSEYCTV